MNQADDDRLVPIGDLPLFTGIWSVVILVVLATAVCI